MLRRLLAPAARRGAAPRQQRSGGGRCSTNRETTNSGRKCILNDVEAPRAWRLRIEPLKAAPFFPVESFPIRRSPIPPIQKCERLMCAAQEFPFFVSSNNIVFALMFAILFF